MTKIGEDIKEALEQGLGVDGIRRLRQNRHNVLGLQEFKEATDKKIKSIVKTGKFHFGGTVWPTGMEAITQTTEYLQTKVTEFLVKSMAEGMVVGFNHGDLKEICTHQWKTSFPDFDSMVGIYAMNIVLAEDARTQLLESFADCLKTFDEAMRVSSMEGKEAAHVWDLWKVALGSGSMAFYICGQNVGEKWKDEEVLQGILSATTVED